MMSSTALLSDPGSHTHLVQAYRDDGGLARTVARYVRQGLDRGEVVLLAATPVHASLFRREIDAGGGDWDGALRSGSLHLLDAKETLARLCRDGRPEWDLFRDVVGVLIEDLRKAAPGRPIRCYGELVDLLWAEGDVAGAVRLEECWGRLLAARPLALMCAYHADLLDRRVDGVSLRSIFCAHSHVLPDDRGGLIEGALRNAMAATLGADRAAALGPLIRATRYRTGMAEPESTIVWLKNNLPALAPSILGRAREICDGPTA